MKSILCSIKAACFTLFLLVMSSFAEKDNYLIIVDDEYINSEKFQEFVEYRKNLYNVTVKSQSEAGSSAYLLRTSISDMYNGEGLKYVLLIGRPGTGLPYETDVHRTFHNFGLVDGDDLLDVALGCFFVSSETELSNIINKVMHTEKNIDSYPKVTTQFTSYTSRPHIEKQCAIIRDTYWKSGESDYEVSWMIPTYESKNNLQYVEDLRNQINTNGSSIISYQAHGGEEGWVDGGAYYYYDVPESRGYSFDVTDVTQLTNDQVYPVIMSFGCVTGSFHQAGGFGETWLTARGGASAFIGSSELSGSYQKCFNAALAECWIDDEIKTLGELFLQAKNKVRSNKNHYTTLMDAPFSSGDEEQMYNLFGDPGMHIKRAPTSIVKSAQNSVHTANTGITMVDKEEITFNLPIVGEYTLSITMANGRVVYATHNQSYKRGPQSLALKGKDLSKGIYFFTITGDGFHRVESFLLQ